MCDVTVTQAGSSSPVSSLSGFSTNSHLEEGGEEGGVTGGGGGGKEDRTPRNDPFAGSSGGSSTTSQANDPFAAFAVPGNDHFSLAGLYKTHYTFNPCLHACMAATVSVH